MSSLGANIQRSGGSKKKTCGAASPSERADVIMASANQELSVSSPEVVARISQAKREFATYQRRDGVFLAAARGHPAADGVS